MEHHKAYIVGGILAAVALIALIRRLSKQNRQRARRAADRRAAEVVFGLGNQPVAPAKPKADKPEKLKKTKSDKPRKPKKTKATPVADWKEEPVTLLVKTAPYTPIADEDGLKVLELNNLGDQIEAARHGAVK